MKPASPTTGTRRYRAALALPVFALLSYFLWTQSRRARSTQLTFAVNDHPKHPPHLNYPILHAELPVRHLPNLTTRCPSEETGGRAGRRLIFIGDVHGMLCPLKRLLKKVAFDPQAGDHIIFTGDMVNKGPDSAGVVQLAIDIGASSVRGNHEHSVLKAAWELLQDHRKRQQTLRPEPSTSNSSSGDWLSELEVLMSPNEPIGTQLGLYDSNITSKSMQVARQLSPSQLAWLASQPVIMSVGYLPPLGDVVTVHAGLMPGTPLLEQDPWTVMNVRTLKTVEVKDDSGKSGSGSSLGLGTRLVPSSTHDGELWAKIWDREMKKIAKTRNHSCKPNVAHISSTDQVIEADKTSHQRVMSVVFGHDAKTGLQLGRYHYGIDSSCVRGGKLSALVVQLAEDGEGVAVDVVSVSCKDSR